MTAGYRVSVFNRTKNKALALIDKGAVWKNSPREVAISSDVIFTILGYPSDVREVYFSEEGIFSGLNKTSFLVDMTTTEPSLAVEIYNRAKDSGSTSIPSDVREVYFSEEGIFSGLNKTSFLVDMTTTEPSLAVEIYNRAKDSGSTSIAVDLMMPLFERMGRNIVYQGETGSGQHTKMCNQIAVAGVMISVCETLLYAHKAGLDVETVLSSITKGAATSWTLENLAPRIIKRDFEAGFYVEHFVKDLKIAMEESKKMGLKLHGLELAYKLYDYLEKLGHGKSGTQALILALEKL
jgi:3-hydroxyisobutyrate dehydrogenase